jgi:hypothetical protein
MRACGKLAVHFPDSKEDVSFSCKRHAFLGGLKESDTITDGGIFATSEFCLVPICLS